MEETDKKRRSKEEEKLNKSFRVEVRLGPLEEEEKKWIGSWRNGFRV